MQPSMKHMSVVLEDQLQLSIVKEPVKIVERGLTNARIAWNDHEKREPSGQMTRLLLMRSCFPTSHWTLMGSAIDGLGLILSCTKEWLSKSMKRLKKPRDSLRKKG